MSDENLRNLTRALELDPENLSLGARVAAAAERVGLDLAARVAVLLGALAIGAARALVSAAREAHHAAALAARTEQKSAENPCGTCGGRGQVVRWDTLDFLYDDGAAEYATCPACGTTDGPRDAWGRQHSVAGRPLDMTRWSPRYDGGRMRTAELVERLYPGMVVVDGRFFTADEAGTDRVLADLAFKVDGEAKRLARLAQPLAGSRVRVVKGRKIARGVEATCVRVEEGRYGWRGLLRMDDGTTAWTALDNLVVTDLNAEERRRVAAVAVQTVGAQVRLHDGRTGTVFWSRDGRIGVRVGPGREDVEWSNACDVAPVAPEAARA